MEISSPLRIVESLEPVKENVNPVLELAKVLLSGDLEVVCALEKAVQSTDYDTISVALVTFFRFYGEANRLLRRMIQQEVNATNEVATLFRGISLTTKLVSAFCMQEGQSYCKNILDPILRMFCIDEVSIEVDPSKVGPNENLAANQEMLLGVCKGLLNHITRSVDQCSYPLRKMFSQTKKIVEKKFPEHNLRVVGGFYFLRFLCPALVCPEGFRLIPAPPGAKSRRSLILVSKILQNLANDVEFGEKESSINTFIKTNQTTMWSFLDQLSNPTKPKNRLSVEMKQDPLTTIHQCIQSHREKIGAILQKNGHGQIYEALCESLDAYASGTIKVRRLSAALPPPSPPAARKRSSSAAPSVSSPPSISSAPVPITASSSSSTPSLQISKPSSIVSPLSPTSSRVSELIPLSSSPSHSLANLLELNLQSPTLPADELSSKLQALSEKSNENIIGKPDGKRCEKVALEISEKAPQKQETCPAVRELEEEMKREMQEIQALKVALESGGMGLKERSETHTRFVNLLQHLKTLLAEYKQLQKVNVTKANDALQEELQLSGLTL